MNTASIMQHRGVRIAIAAVLVGFLAAATAAPKDAPPVEGFDIDRYLGTWYEIARLDHRFERGLSRVTAEYSRNDNGTIKVVNRGYHEEKGVWKEATGKAKFRGEADVGALKVSFFGPFYGRYDIIDLDDAYQVALVSGGSPKYLWILSRTPTLDPDVYERLVEKARQYGFPVDDLIHVDHATEAP